MQEGGKANALRFGRSRLGYCTAFEIVGKSVLNQNLILVLDFVQGKEMRHER